MTWSGRSVLVTGANGFIGAWLVQRLVDEGARVIALVAVDEPDSEFSRAGLHDRTTVTHAIVVKRDVTDRLRAERALRESEEQFRTLMQSAIDAILEGLSWLELDWDGDTIYQFSRSARHREVAEQLLANGSAYLCYASAEELAQMREQARREGRPEEDFNEY